MILLQPSQTLLGFSEVKALLQVLFLRFLIDFHRIDSLCIGDRCWVWFLKKMLANWILSFLSQGHLLIPQSHSLIFSWLNVWVKFMYALKLYFDGCRYGLAYYIWTIFIYVRFIYFTAVFMCILCTYIHLSFVNFIIANIVMLPYWMICYLANKTYISAFGHAALFNRSM